MPIRLIPFQPELLPQAGELLARRHRRDRAVLPELPARFEDAQVAQQAIEAALQRKQAHGFAALDGERLLGYLIGDIVIEEIWGRSAWVRTASYAYDPAAGVEIVRDLYAALGERWVAQGIFSHFALIPVADPALIQAWFSLSFGIEQIHGLMDLAVLNSTAATIPDGIEIYQAGPADRQRVASMSDVIWQTQVKAPCWGIMLPELVSDVTAGWAELVDEAESTVWLALSDGETVGIQAYYPALATAENLSIPEQCAHLTVAGTRPTQRGQGIGSLLTQHGLTQARSAGFRFCETDWRSANLLASRFWPRMGFRPTIYRLVRRIDQRIAWATGPVL